MEGVSIVPTETLTELMNTINTVGRKVEEISTELKSLKEPYMTTTEVSLLTKFGEKWVQDNKEKLGFKSIGGNLRFRRKDVVAFMEQDFYKAKRK